MPIKSITDLTPITEPMNWDKCFDYPISSFLDRAGSWSYGPVFGEENADISEEEMMDWGTFDTAYYAQEGENDGEEWIFVVKTTNDYYIYFDASCDYTGFDCQGGGTIRYSHCPEKLWWQGLSEELRQKLTGVTPEKKTWE